MPDIMVPPSASALAELSFLSPGRMMLGAQGVFEYAPFSPFQNAQSAPDVKAPKRDCAPMAAALPSLPNHRDS